VTVSPPLRLFPLIARGLDRIGIVAVEQEDRAFIARKLGHRAIYQKTYVRGVGISVGGGQHHGHVTRFRFAVGAVRQETVVGIGP
jgi:hypothetical protein